MTKPMKVCGCCHRTFIPQFTEEELIHLFYEEEHIERVRFLEQEYPGYAPNLNVPVQDICEKCVENPDRVSYLGFNGKRIHKIEKKEAAVEDEK